MPKVQKPLPCPSLLPSILSLSLSLPLKLLRSITSFISFQLTSALLRWIKCWLQVDVITILSSYRVAVHSFNLCALKFRYLFFFPNYHALELKREGLSLGIIKHLN